MKKILFIEDEAALQKVVGDALLQDGYQVLSALDGESGISLALREQPDLVLLDLVLPKKDGFVVLETLKKDPTTARIPVIIMSNLGGSADVERALELGARTFLVKTNYKLEEVVEKIKGLLEK
ncbi:MAG: response regulator [Patescibacteria group bacterium]